MLAKHMNIPASLMVAFCMDKTDPFSVVSTEALEPEWEYSITNYRVLSGILCCNVFNYVLSLSNFPVHIVGKFVNVPIVELSAS